VAVSCDIAYAPNALDFGFGFGLYRFRRFDLVAREQGGALVLEMEHRLAVGVEVEPMLAVDLREVILGRCFVQLVHVNQCTACLAAFAVRFECRCHVAVLMCGVVCTIAPTNPTVDMIHLDVKRNVGKPRTVTFQKGMSSSSNWGFPLLTS
jgi:hypothetical protein